MAYAVHTHPPDMFVVPGERAFTPIPVPNGTVQFCSPFYDKAAADRFFSSLMSQTQWREEQVTVWGRKHKQPRLIAWHGDPDARYRYAGLMITPSPWTSLLEEIRHDVQAASNARFNSVLLNLYRNERDRMGWHSDDEPELGRNPTIGSLSLGEERVFKLRHKQHRHKDVHIRLTHGSLLVMGGELQHHWKHAIDREPGPKGPRINLTFRLIKNNATAA